MDKNKENINQHYIPRCYLQYFSINGKMIWNKKATDISSECSIKEICCEDDLYTIHTEIIDRCVCLEQKVLSAKIETPYGDYLKNIYEAGKKFQSKKCYKNRVLNDDEKFLFAAFIAIQYIRMPKFKRYFDLIAQDAMNTDFIRFMGATLKYEAENVELNTYPFVSASLLHANFGYNNIDIIAKYANYLYDNYWEFLITTCPKVCTSNNPIHFADNIPNNASIPYSKEDLVKFIALSTVFEEHVTLPYDALIHFDSFIGFPITKYIYLRIWNKNKFPEKRNIDCLFSDMSDDTLADLNQRTLKDSEEIYSAIQIENIFQNI